MKTRSIKQITKAQKIKMGDNFIEQPLPASSVDMVDPFLLVHHWKSTLPGGQRNQDVGVGPHPHRGFSPVTFVFKGEIEHRDSLNNIATVKEGGTQWMFAGRGITHSERFGQQLAENGGDLEFIQFWVNAPSKHKMDAPFYKPISESETPLIEEQDAKLWVVSGNLNCVEGVAPTNSPQLLLRGEIKENGNLEIPVSTDFNALLYLLDGELIVDNKGLSQKEMAIFNNDGEIVSISAKKNTRFILLAGTPLNEAVESYGPFVMNNQTEVMQAIRDAQMGKMGILIEDFS